MPNISMHLFCVSNA